MNPAKETNFENFGFTCPNCNEYYRVFWGQIPVSEEKYNQLRRITERQIELGYCKKCHRKDPTVPTTFEMDGIITKEDMQDRNKVVFQCRDCKKWTQMESDDRKDQCGHCGSSNFDSTSIKSLRTYNEETDKKRKPKVKK